MFMCVRRVLASFTFEQNLTLFSNRFKYGMISNVKKYSTKKEKLRLVSEKAQAKYFIDFKRIRVFGGDGGDGSSSFLSIYGNEFAGPDGGNGGNGGHIIFRAENSVNSLCHIYPIYRGQMGEKGRGRTCHGANAESTYVNVPLGTFFRNESGEVIADLKEAGDVFLAARGGAGGKGNYHFLNNDNRAPTTYEKGGKGEEKLIYAELRVIAYLGLVGLPNAGKSSLLRSLTRAKPKVGSYQFTTLFPHVGTIEFDYEQVAIADIPGLIEGAHTNKGLGFSFLRHVEQCQSLAYVIDLSHDNVVWQLEMLKNEIEHYKPGLSKKPHFIVGNKIDIELSKKNYDKLVDYLKDTDTVLIPVSAKKKINLPELIAHVRRIYESNSNSKIESNK